MYSYVTCYFEFNKADTARVTVSKQTLKLVSRNSLLPNETYLFSFWAPACARVVCACASLVPMATDDAILIFLLLQQFMCVS